jgi:hypothetical protein
MCATGGSRFFSRSKLLDVLVANIPKDRVQFGKKLISYEHEHGETGEITLHFSDGTSARCDVLIAADGIHSVIRKQMYNDAAAAKDAALGSHFDVEKFIEPTWTGTTAYRSLIPTEELRKVCPNHSILKEPQMVSALPVFQSNLTHSPVKISSTLVKTGYVLPITPCSAPYLRIYSTSSSSSPIRSKSTWSRS